MNDEIKEILYKLKDDDWYDELDLTGDKWIELKQTETKQILDYITNLQQIEQEHKKINGELREENSKLEIALQNIQEDYDRRTEENERLKEELQQEKKDFKEANDYCFELKDYKSRCEKTSEYFKYQLENLDFYEDTKARMLCAMGITLLQNGSDDND